MTTKIELLPDERRTEMTNNIKLLPLPEGNVAHLIAAQEFVFAKFVRHPGYKGDA